MAMTPEEKTARAEERKQQKLLKLAQESAERQRKEEAWESVKELTFYKTFFEFAKLYEWLHDELGVDLRYETLNDTNFAKHNAYVTESFSYSYHNESFTFDYQTVTKTNMTPTLLERVQEFMNCVREAVDQFQEMERLLVEEEMRKANVRLVALSKLTAEEKKLLNVK